MHGNADAYGNNPDRTDARLFAAQIPLRNTSAGQIQSFQQRGHPCKMGRTEKGGSFRHQAHPAHHHLPTCRATTSAQCPRKQGCSRHGGTAAGDTVCRPCGRASEVQSDGLRELHHIRRLCRRLPTAEADAAELRL